MSTTLLMERAPAAVTFSASHCGRRADLDASDDARRVARAQPRILDLDRALLGGRGADLHRMLRGHSRRRPKHRADLAGDARHRQAVGAVRRDLELEHGVGQAVPLREGRTDRGVRREDHESVVVLAEPQLARRAVHALAHDTAQLRLLDVKPPGSTAPTSATGTLSPASKF